MAVNLSSWNGHLLVLLVDCPRSVDYSGGSSRWLVKNGNGLNFGFMNNFLTFVILSDLEYSNCFGGLPELPDVAS